MVQVRKWLRRLGVPGRDRRDLVQEVMLAAHQSFPKYDPARGPPDRWLNRIVVHAASHYGDRKRRRPEEPLPDDYDAELDAPSAEELIARESERLLVLELLREMDFEHSSVLMAHDIEGISMVEYASQANIPVSTAYKRRIRAFAVFQELASVRLGLAGTSAPDAGA